MTNASLPTKKEAKLDFLYWFNGVHVARTFLCPERDSEEMSLSAPKEKHKRLFPVARLKILSMSRGSENTAPRKYNDQRPTDKLLFICSLLFYINYAYVFLWMLKKVHLHYSCGKGNFKKYTKSSINIKYIVLEIRHQNHGDVKLSKYYMARKTFSKSKFSWKNLKYSRWKWTVRRRSRKQTIEEVILKIL